MSESPAPAVLWDVLKDGVMVITLQRPRANALGLPIIEGIGAALDEAERRGDIKVIVVTSNLPGFFAAGADINAADTRGQTALHGAALQGLDRVVQFLADNGAVLDANDKRGFTPLDAALGLAGGVGFDGRSGNPHESTAALLRQLMK